MDFTQPSENNLMKKAPLLQLLQDNLRNSRLSHRMVKAFFGKLKEILPDLGILTAVEAREHTTVDATIRIV